MHNFNIFFYSFFSRSFPSRIAHIDTLSVLAIFRFGFKMPGQNGAVWWWSRKENQLTARRVRAQLILIRTIRIVHSTWTSRRPRQWSEVDFFFSSIIRQSLYKALVSKNWMEKSQKNIERSVKTAKLLKIASKGVCSHVTSSILVLIDGKILINWKFFGYILSFDKKVFFSWIWRDLKVRSVRKLQNIILLDMSSITLGTLNC